MAFKGVLRPGMIQLRVLDMDEAINHYQNILGLNIVCKGGDGRVYFKGWDEFDHHSVVLREADSAGMDLVAYKVDSDQYLTDIEPKIVAWVWHFLSGAASAARSGCPPSTSCAWAREAG